jgi:hypothetical protein
MYTVPLEPMFFQACLMASQNLQCPCKRNSGMFNATVMLSKLCPYYGVLYVCPYYGVLYVKEEHASILFFENSC